MDVDEPSNIKWENQDVSNCEFNVRKYIVYIYILILMLISVIFLASANALTVTNNCKDDIVYKKEEW